MSNTSSHGSPAGPAATPVANTAVPAPYAAPYGWLPEHPQGTVVLVLGILGFVTGVTGIVAWILGSQAQKEIRASGFAYSNEQNIAIGKICGIISSLLVLAGFALVLLYLIGMLIFFGSFLAQLPR